MEHTDILRIIYDSVDETNRQLPADGQLEKSLDTALLGDGSRLDSLGLIMFLVSFEEALDAVHGVRFDLLEDEFLSDPEGPLRNVRSLAAFVQERC